MEWIQLSLRVSWCLAVGQGISGARRLPFSPSGGLFDLIRTYTMVSVQSFRNVNCIRVREYACALAYARYMSPEVRCHTVRTFENSSTLDLYTLDRDRCNSSAFYYSYSIWSYILHVAQLHVIHRGHKLKPHRSCDLRLMRFFDRLSLFFFIYRASLENEFSEIMIYHEIKLYPCTSAEACFVSRVRSMACALSLRVMRKIKEITF